MAETTPPPTTPTPTATPKAPKRRRTPHIFLSHSHRDDEFTNKLAADLRAAGVDVWLDQSDVNSGDFMERINEALRTREWMVLVQTPEALRSSAVRSEVNAALSLVFRRSMRGVVRVVAAPCDPAEVPATWSTLPAFDATADYQKALAGVLAAIGLGPRVRRRALLAGVAGLAAVAVAGTTGALWLGGQQRTPRVTVRATATPTLAPPTPTATPSPPALRWQYPMGMITIWKPILANSTVCFIAISQPGPAGGPALYALDATTGKPIWSHTAPQGAFNQAIANGDFVHTTMNGSVVTFASADGAQLWSYTLGPAYFAMVGPVANGVVYASLQSTTSAPSVLVALDAKAGTLLWKFQADDPSLPPGAVSLGTALYAIGGKGYLYALDPATGKVTWRVQPIGPNSVVASPIAGTGVIYVTAGQSLFALDTATGAAQWHYAMPTALSPIATANSLIYAISPDNEVYAISTDQPSVIWHTPVSSPTVSGQAVVSYDPTGSAPIYAGGPDGSVYAIDPRTGAQLWSQSVTKDSVANLIVSGDVVYAATTDGGLSTLSTTGGTPLYHFAATGTMKPKGGPAITTLLAGPGSLYFGAQDSNLYALTIFGPPGS